MQNERLSIHTPFLPLQVGLLLPLQVPLKYWPEGQDEVHTGKLFLPIGCVLIIFQLSPGSS